MPPRTRATLRSRYWKEFLGSIRFCAVCGGALKIRYLREEKCRRRVCVQCRAITYINPKMVAGVIPVAPDGRVALLRRNIEPALGKWTYPAGFQELGETVMHAAIREAKEEIGIPVLPGGLVGIYSYHDAGVVTVVYAGRIGARQKPRVTDEALEVALFMPRDIPWKDLAFRSTRDALKDWLKSKTSMTE